MKRDLLRWRRGFRAVILAPDVLFALADAATTRSYTGTGSILSTVSLTVTSFFRQALLNA